ncbi:hypothetical protein ACF1BS_03055 [Streptomyces sp. NPDC014748]|uniref:hypothetical protein n=1 Tax=Streptomyces sp. NPDC014748 TaxID=3364905 RepID=UPI0036F7E4AF
MGLTLLISVGILYAAACGAFGAERDAPLWLRWPLPLWNRIAHDWRRPIPVPSRPDYAKIERLERELGIIDAESERPMHHGPNVCLTRGCVGRTRDIRTWSGVLARQVHECEEWRP